MSGDSCEKSAHQQDDSATPVSTLGLRVYPIGFDAFPEFL
jgi:hypothetical protein